MTRARRDTTLEGRYALRAELLDEWVAIGDQIAALEARRAAVLAERLDLFAAETQGLAAGSAEVSFRSMSAEYAAAGRVPQATAEKRITDAWMLVRCFPAVHRSLSEGRISTRHAEVILSEAPPVSGQADAETVRADYQAQVLPFAEKDTAARTRVHARGVAARLSPQSVVGRHRRARSERMVSVRPDGEGMAVLTAILPELLAQAIHDRLTAMAKDAVDQRPPGRKRATSADRRARAEAEAAARAQQQPSDPPPPPDAGAIEIDEAPWMADERHGTAGGAADPGRSAADLERSATEAEFASGYRDPDGFEDESGPPFLASMPIDDGYGVSETDTRSMDQLRADIFADLLLTTDPSTARATAAESIRARISVTIAASTLTGEDDRLSELDGHGPLLSDLGRILAGYAPSWDRVFLDPRGMAVRTDNYVPTAEMKRYLRVRDQHCRFPGCRAPVQRCQIDHNHDHALGGATAIENLSLLCTAHHPLKHPDVRTADRWTARQRSDGVIVWTSPIGRSYADEPPLRVMFA